MLRAPFTRTDIAQITQRFSLPIGLDVKNVHAKQLSPVFAIQITNCNSGIIQVMNGMLSYAYVKVKHLIYLECVKNIGGRYSPQLSSRSQTKRRFEGRRRNEHTSGKEFRCICGDEQAWNRDTTNILEFGISVPTPTSNHMLLIKPSKAAE